MLTDIKTAISLAGAIVGFLAGVESARRGKDGGTVAAGGGLTALVGFLTLLFALAFEPPARRYVGLPGLGMFTAGFGSIAAGALVYHFEKLRERWEKEGHREFRFPEFLKGETFFWVWWFGFIGATPVADMIRYRGPELRERLVGDAWMSGIFLAAFLLLIGVDLWLVRRWRRLERPAGARDAA